MVTIPEPALLRHLAGLPIQELDFNIDFLRQLPNRDDIRHDIPGYPQLRSLNDLYAKP